MIIGISGDLANKAVAFSASAPSNADDCLIVRFRSPLSGKLFLGFLKQCSVTRHACFTYSTRWTQNCTENHSRLRLDDLISRDQFRYPPRRRSRPRPRAPLSITRTRRRTIEMEYQPDNA